VATNARLTKEQASRVALMADDGLARAINPSHTLGDGDTVFALATGRWEGQADLSLIGALAAEAMAEAIVRAVSKAESLGGLPSARELDTVPPVAVSYYLALVIAYAIGISALDLWTARLIRNSGDFFVAGRRLGAGLIFSTMFSTMFAANIGAGATVGVAGLAYRDGISAWWWSGSAGLGSLVLAFWVGPRLWRLAKEHGFYTTGDFLDYRYGPSVRVTVAVVIALISLVILAAQLIAGAAIVTAITGAPRWVGALIGGGVMTIYFAAGGLLGTAWVNTLQLMVMLVGFVGALPFVLGAVGGVGALTAAPAPAWFGDFTYSAGPYSGWTLVALTGPAFVISPGLIQKAYGARSEPALRLGIGLNAAALGGLCSKRAGASEALAAIAVGLITLTVIGLGLTGPTSLDPTLTGLAASAAAYLVVLAVRRPPTVAREP
jgi:Na+/proline symporter